jgi:hypothetical protein
MAERQAGQPPGEAAADNNDIKMLGAAHGATIALSRGGVQHWRALCGE